MTAVPIAPGGELRLTLNDRYFAPQHSQIGTLPVGAELYVQVDSSNTATTYGAVLEGHEANGGPYNNVSRATVGGGAPAAAPAEAPAPPALDTAALPPRR